VNLPPGNNDLWAKIDLPYSLKGRLRKTAYKANAIYLTVSTQDKTARFRVLPGVLTSSFPLKAFPVDFKTFESALRARRIEAPIERVRLDTDYADDYGEPSLTLIEEGESPLTFVAPFNRTLQEEFGFFTSTAIARTAEGSIDIINDIRNPRRMPDELQPLPLEDGKTLTLIGWMADRSDGRAFDDVYAVVDGRLIRAKRSPRPDVAAHFKNPAMELCGFEVEIQPSRAPKGIHKVELIGVVQKDRTPYRLRQSLVVNFGGPAKHK
jgi:hypothetical protein